MKSISTLVLSLPLVTCSILAPLSRSTAQIIPDVNLGGTENSVVNPDAINGIPSDRIDGGAIRGSNLFHSFQEFNVLEGRGAYFSNPNGITNILTRVTGRNPSNILGKLGVLGNANLFLLNPKGIFFGPNASLDLAGSFLATTADSLVFDNNFEFSASNPQAPPQLTVNIPIGLRFRDNPGNINVQGPGNNLQFNPEFLEFSRNSTPPGLAVQPGKTLALVGGDVNLEGGNLLADGGRIEVGSVDSSSFVSITPIDKGWQLGYTNVPAFRDISLTKKASIDSSSEAGAGEIQVQGRNIKLTDGSAIFAFTGSQPGGTVSVNAADTLEVSGISSNDSVPSTMYTAVSPGGSGTGSNLTIQSKRIIASGGAQIGADTYGEGAAGNVVVKASDLIEIQGSVVIDETLPPVPTAIGTIAQASSTGPGTKLTLETRRLKITDGGQLVTGTFSQSQAGTLDITASESTELSGEGSAISSVVGKDATGNGGTVILKTPNLIIRDQAKINVDGQGSGNAGEVRVTSDTIRLENKGGITAQASSGNGGDIYLDVQDYLLMSGESVISTEAIDGNGGNIYINTLTNNRGFIVAQPFGNNDIIANADQGQGGKVVINSNGIFGLFVRTRQDWERLRPQDLDPRNLFTSDITAISRQNASLSGTVQLNTIDVDPSQALVELPNNLPDPRDQIAQNPCQRGIGSEFTITGRGGLPPSPNETLTGNNIQVDLVKPAIPGENSQSANIHQPKTFPIAGRDIIPAQGWIFNKKGEVVLTAYDPTGNIPQRNSTTAVACPAHL
ncbi:filamentous hemagglutinin N-terminal domain-containing protein [Fischerella thermalis]|uniref:two-partner secretion domain-containing protein n=1 Tax=Fischerella thermalis TaxID=372787 RepID=UPI001A00EB55|nr:filamentous hemagglutinin N-terminal domain-containing protein [Fischerella thermalis]MBF1989885.1 filamentous hemagglutinin N-terminal domain-containing protein [Fischerella thermalis M58_A2018_009]MBF2060294.1 filamentous hemagglutinin N-terminal domain-containing protein [Fischerella thermalis M66_A2018_004]